VEYLAPNGIRSPDPEGAMSALQHTITGAKADHGYEVPTPKKQKYQ
jgi:hypothetical protein